MCFLLDKQTVKCPFQHSLSQTLAPVVSLNTRSSVLNNRLSCQLSCFFFCCFGLEASSAARITAIKSIVVLLYLCFWTIGNQRRNRLTECKPYEVSPPLCWYFKHIKIPSFYFHGIFKASLLFMCHIVTSSLQILGAKWLHTIKREISVDKNNYQQSRNGGFNTCKVTQI